MDKMIMDTTLERTYRGNGQHAEQMFRFTLTGEVCKADNVPFWVAADCLDFQVKSARATVCRGTDIAAHIARDAANRYAYVISDFSMAYIMTPTEWLEFTTLFSEVTRDSQKNGGHIKTKLRKESKAMREWLESHSC